MKPPSKLRSFWRNLPLRLKIAGSVSLLILLIAPLLAAVIIQLETTNARREAEEQAQLFSDALATLLGDLIYFERDTQIEAVAIKLNEFPQITTIKVYGANENLLYSREAADQGREIVRKKDVVFGANYVGRVEVGLSTATLDKNTQLLIIYGAYLILLAIGIGAFLAIWMAKQLTSPISELIQTAKKMASGDLSTRYGGPKQDEIGQLGTAFNEMAVAIERRDAELRNQAGILAQKVDERTVELQQKNQYLEALNNVTVGLIRNTELKDLLDDIMERAAKLANTRHAIVYVLDPSAQRIQLRVAKGRYDDQPSQKIKANQGLAGRVIESGEVMIETDYQQFEGRLPGYEWLHTCIYMPLRSETQVFGVIGLGYDKVVPVKEDTVRILQQFAQLASLALTKAQLYSDAKEKLRLEEERRQAHLISPLGRAETLTEEILEDPAKALVSIYAIAQQADQEGMSAVLLALPTVLENKRQQRLAEVASGFQFLRKHRTMPTFLVDGLSTLEEQLGLPGTESLEHATEARSLYALSRRAIEADSLQDVTELLPDLQEIREATNSGSPFSDLAGMLSEFSAVAKSLHSYERVETTEDRRSYLSAAVEKLSQIERKVQSLRAADRPIAERIFEKWLAIITASLTDIKTLARIKWRLVNRNTWEADVVTIALELTNAGHGTASNLTVDLEESPDYEILDGQEFLEQLPPTDEAPIEFRIKPRPGRDSHQLRFRCSAVYDDPGGSGQVEHFADVIHVMATPPAFQYIANNPYVASAPLEAGSPLFYGREDLFKFISENIKTNTLVLIGQRRTGKSSLLMQLPQHLGDEFVPVYLDGQGITVDTGMAAFCMNLADEVNHALEERGLKAINLSERKFEQSPARTFERDYLRGVKSVIRDRQLVLMLDEFEELESAVKKGRLDDSVFNLLRHLVQHEPSLTMIFCGIHSLEELTADYFSVLFNISIYKHVGFLEHEEALRLIQEPVAAFGMAYDDLALDKMWRITSGHPYFLQKLCHGVVNHHNRSGRSYITLADVNESLEEILDTAEAHFVYLWNESGPQERQVLAALSRMMPLGEKVTAVQVEDYLVGAGISLGRQAVSETLNRLKLRDILERHMDNQPSGFGGTYAWRLGLLGSWIEKYKSISVVQEEMHS